MRRRYDQYRLWDQGSLNQPATQADLDAVLRRNDQWHDDTTWPAWGDHPRITPRPVDPTPTPATQPTPPVQPTPPPTRQPHPDDIIPWTILDQTTGQLILVHLHRWQVHQLRTTDALAHPQHTPS